MKTCFLSDKVQVNKIEEEVFWSLELRILRSIECKAKGQTQSITSSYDL